MSESKRNKKCDCWCKLEWCPVDCKETPQTVFDDNPTRTPKICRNMYVDYTEL